MRRRLFLSGSVLFLLSCVSIYPLVNWNGITITADVVDDDIAVSGSNIIKGDILVKAETVDVTLFINADSILTGQQDGAQPPYLVLYVAQDRTMTFSIDNNLKFLGDTAVDLLITVSGDGDVIFVMGDGKKLEFTSDVANEGTRFFLIMNGSLKPFIGFTRKSTASDEHVYIDIGAKSILSYLGDDTIDGSETTGGTIRFTPSNTGKGRMALSLYDTGCVLVQGNKIPQKAQRDLTLADIDMTTPAGLQPRLETTALINPNEHAGLLVINRNATYTDLLIDPWMTGVFNGNRYGFIVGPNGLVSIGSWSYFDYVGLSQNFCPNPTIPPNILNGRTVASVVKPRNASALIIDGDPNNIAESATFVLSCTSVLLFRSGVDDDGNVSEFDADMQFSFTIDPSNETSGAGNIVLDVEGIFTMTGSLDGIVSTTGICPNRLEILSLDVGYTGGPVFYDTTETVFPKRTFAKDAQSAYLRYNSACFLLNNRFNTFGMWLVHTDENHLVYENDDVNSEPTYIGGDTFALPTPNLTRPNLVLFNSEVMLHSSCGVTGLDLFVPGSISLTNESALRFFYNGLVLDDGSGRNLILGTEIGSLACDASSVVSHDANLNIFAEVSGVNKNPHTLLFTVGANNDIINENITGSILGQFSVQTLYLGHSSNVVVGHPDIPGGIYQATCNVGANYFSFETRGGSNSSPETSNVTGEGGIFLYRWGVFMVSPDVTTSISTMITKDKYGDVYLPKNQVYFDDRVGIAPWQPDLSDPDQRIIIEADEYFSNYTLNWIDFTKDYTGTGTVFVPYDLETCEPYSGCTVSRENISSLPTIKGAVEQLQIKGSRLGNKAYFMVDDGSVGEVVFLGGTESGDIPGAFVVVQEDSSVGIGSKHRNKDSLDSSVVMGVNGITIIANGDGQIVLNEDVIVNNRCQILVGPDFGLQGNSFDSDFDPDDPRVTTTQVLELYSDCCRSLIIQGGGQLDLTSFTSANQVLKFAGSAHLVLEPGAQVLFNGGTLVMTDQAQILVQRASVKNAPIEEKPISPAMAMAMTMAMAMAMA